MITAKTLKQFPLFSSFTKGELDEILEHSTIKQLKEHDVLFTIGDKRDTFFIVIEGKVAIVRQLGEISQIIEIVTKGEYIVEHALFDPKASHSHTGIIHSQSAVVLNLRGTDFQKLSLDTRYKLIRGLMPIISDNFSHASNRIMTISQVGQLLGNIGIRVRDLGESILHILLEAIHAQKGMIVLQKADPTRASVVATVGFASNHDLLYQTLTIADDQFLDAVIFQGKLVNMTPAQYLVSSKKVDYVSQSILGAPLIVSSSRRGVLFLIDKNDIEGFSANNEVLVNIVAQMVSFGLHYTQHREIQEAEKELQREYISI